MARGAGGRGSGLGARWTKGAREEGGEERGGGGGGGRQQPKYDLVAPPHTEKSLQVPLKKVPVTTAIHSVTLHIPSDLCRLKH